MNTRGKFLLAVVLATMAIDWWWNPNPPPTPTVSFTIRTAEVVQGLHYRAANMANFICDVQMNRQNGQNFCLVTDEVNHESELSVRLAGVDDPHRCDRLREGLTFEVSPAQRRNHVSMRVTTTRMESENTFLGLGKPNLICRFGIVPS